MPTNRASLLCASARLPSMHTGPITTENTGRPQMWMKAKMDFEGNWFPAVSLFVVARAKLQCQEGMRLVEGKATMTRESPLMKTAWRIRSHTHHHPTPIHCSATSRTAPCLAPP